MSKFEVGQKWKTRKGEIVTVVYIGMGKLAVETYDGIIFAVHMDGYYLWELESTFDLVEQVVEPKYRPFANAAEYEPHRSKWVQRQRDSGWRGHCLVVAYDDEGIDLCTYDGTWQAAFENLRFEDGTPFGVRVS